MVGRITAAFWSAYFLFSAVAMGQSPVKVTIDTRTPGALIPADFSGLSFETASLRYDNAGVNGYFFDSTNTQLLTLFRELGIKNLRIGGASVDSITTPSHRDIDALFRFARAAGVKVIYSLRLLNGDPPQDASAAKYIWDNYRQYLDCFAIGNEPNIYAGKDPQITDFSSYLAKWKTFAAAIIDSVPDARFGGPDNDTHGALWGTNFAYYELGTGIVKSIFFHYYVGQGADGKTAQELIDEMLSPTWVANYYPAQYRASGGMVSAIGFLFRFTESNSYYTHSGSLGVPGGNSGFATALFALDYMHWWAAHNCAGVNFHTFMWKYNGTVYRDTNGDYQVYPIGYGIMAFNLGGHGHVQPVTISNSDSLDLTAYAVMDTNALYVTIVNKEHGSDARNASVTISANGLSDTAAAVYLTSPGNSDSATAGVTLGGAAINDSGSWQGKWTALDSAETGEYVLDVPASSAAIVMIPGTLASVSNSLHLPGNFALSQNYPDPFNPSTEIKVSLDQAGVMSLKVYNVMGQLVDVVAQGYKPAGEYTYNANMNRLASGVYFYTLRQGNSSITKKMLLLK